jgi:short-subunit dehydrogenase
MPDRTHGGWALITGASSGLGADFARELASRGCNCVLVARRENRLRELAEELARDHGAEAEIIPMDLSVPGVPAELHRRLAEKGIRIDVLVNSAGFGIFDRFLDIPWERERAMIELDVLALVHLTKLFARDMVERGYGRILQIASTAAYQAVPYYSTYAGCKSFVLLFGEALHYELAGTGVTCTVLSPGTTDTEFQSVAGHDYTMAMSGSVMNSRAVARIGIEAMLRGRSSVLAGLRNQALVWLERLTPRTLITRIAARFTGSPR